MICRGGDVTDGWMAPSPSAMRVKNGDAHCARRPRFRAMILATCVLAVPLLLFSIHDRIPPSIESDYCYQLVAADRLVEGWGLTTTPPVAPHQPWEWSGDWAHLTRWPPGYSLLIAGIRTLFGVSTLTACAWISALACAAAFVGWFAWGRTMVPRGVTGWLIALVCGMTSVSVAGWVDPSTDQLLVAIVPWLMLACLRWGARSAGAPENDANTVSDAFSAEPGAQATGLSVASNMMSKPGAILKPSVMLKPVAGAPGSDCRVAVILGLFAGGLFWLRYASIFVPAAILLFLLITRFIHRNRQSLRFLASYGAGVIVPVAALIGLNGFWGRGESAASQLNLGQSIGFDISIYTFVQAWSRFTNLGYYDYRPETGWFLALWPVVMLLSIIFIPNVRARVAAAIIGANHAATTSQTSGNHDESNRLRAGAFRLSACLVVALLTMLIAATTLFRGKFDYVGLDRYYAPVKPLYVLLFVAPVLFLRWKSLRLGVMVFALMAASWTVQQDWLRTYQRWAAADRPRTGYGQWASCFSDNADAIYSWLRQQRSPDLVVVSNFHEWLALETGIPALPIPLDKPTFERWTARIAESRGVSPLRVLFVLDESNRWRDSWIPKPESTIDMLALAPASSVPAELRRWILEPSTINHAMAKRTSGE